MIVACVLRSGGIYDPEWVDRLYYSVKANWDVERALQFVCLSDIRWSAPYHLAPLRHGWPGWWSKMELLNGCGVCQGATLYLDLDNVINGPMSLIVQRPMRNDDFGLRVMRDPNTQGLQSAVMRWSSQWVKAWGDDIYREFARDAARWMRDYSQATDQGLIAEWLTRAGKRWGYFSEQEVTSYKAHWRDGAIRTSAVVQLHGHPKPYELPPEHQLRRVWDQHYESAVALKGVVNA